ncbi:adenine-specific methyltransferase EcoRI family protein [Treponema endosymbiont of Eucomonympha sp.]|uniref:adenine-specific methyltransferase EcoRI family protein n=1 Tax=Treponema endosymbiont of Eucomonympha sp. TaxID=1580831 RepID=UPI00075199DC|nr:adenine-specific methyltransferase EcoRI family protein [Treponema endosymbiont of Eucomonympha sp.]
MANSFLTNARKHKADEFYTQLPDIERELKNYKEQFAGKTVFCNCDDPEYSNFYYYFVSNYDELGLKKLISTHFESAQASYTLEYGGGADVRGDKEAVIRSANRAGTKTALKQNFEQGAQAELFEKEPTRSFSGDFRAPECVELLKQADIVVTNPPFSLFREYVEQLMQYEKKFLIIGSLNAITYKEIFRYIKNNKLWLGYGFQGGNAYFSVSDARDYASGVYNSETGLVKFRNVSWYTNMDIKKRHEDLILYKKYAPEEYPKYDNYDTIEVSKLVGIPQDYIGVMGVPITFLDKYNPEQFEIIGIDRYVEDNPNYGKRFTLNGKETYARILIRNRKPVRPKKRAGNSGAV